MCALVVVSSPLSLSLALVSVFDKGHIVQWLRLSICNLGCEMYMPNGCVVLTRLSTWRIVACTNDGFVRSFVHSFVRTTYNCHAHTLTDRHTYGGGHKNYLSMRSVRVCMRFFSLFCSSIFSLFPIRFICSVSYFPVLSFDFVFVFVCDGAICWLTPPAWLYANQSYFMVGSNALVII